MRIKEHRLHVDSPDIDFSLLELKKNYQKVFKFTSKNLFEPSCIIIGKFSFLLHCQYWLKSFFKIKYFLGNQKEATKEEIKVLVT